MTDRELLELVAQKVNGLDQKVTNIESRLTEHSEILTALQEVNEIHTAKIDGLDQKVSSIEQNMVTKDELNKIRETMVTKDDLNRAIAESQKDILAMLQHIEKKLDNQSDQLEAKFDVLNDRLFNQEAQLRHLKKQAQ